MFDSSDLKNSNNSLYELKESRESLEASATASPVLLHSFVLLSTVLRGGPMRRTVRLLSTAVLSCGVVTALAGAPHVALAAEELKVGDQAPDFTLPGSDGKTHTLSQLKGKHVVLAWFPKAFTGG